MFISAGQSLADMACTGGQGQDRTVDLPLFRPSVTCPKTTRSIHGPSPSMLVIESSRALWHARGRLEGRRAGEPRNCCGRYHAQV